MMKTLLDKLFHSDDISFIDAIEPMIRREREMYWEEKRKADGRLELLRRTIEGKTQCPICGGIFAYIGEKPPRLETIGHKHDCELARELGLQEDSIR